jgi:hypothetical protein
MQGQEGKVAGDGAGACRGLNPPRKQNHVPGTWFRRGCLWQAQSCRRNNVLTFCSGTDQGAEMSRLYPDVTTESGQQEALKAGTIAALISAGITFLGLVVFMLGVPLETPIYGEDEKAQLSKSAVENAGVATGIVIQMFVMLLCAWRFHKGKGKYVGLVAALVMGLELINKIIAFSFLPVLFIGWIVLTLANGVRGAWARPTALTSDAD